MTNAELSKQTITSEMTYEKATKNKYVFSGPAGSAVEAIYVSQSACVNQPAKVRVTIECSNDRWTLEPLAFVVGAVIVG